MRFLLAIIIGFWLGPVMADGWTGPDDVLQAAKAGNPEAQLEMGILYQYGFNMPGNNVPALAWYLSSAEQGNQSATSRSDILQKQMLPTEVEEARQLSQNLAVLSSLSSETTAIPGYKPEGYAEGGSENGNPPAGVEMATDPDPATGQPGQGQSQASGETSPEPLPDLGPGTELLPEIETPADANATTGTPAQ
ncbi:MAG: hypothetical protein ACC635_06955 [Acidiferrobacterales bacterium]